MMRLAVIKKDGKYLSASSWISDIERARIYWIHSDEIAEDIQRFGGYKKEVFVTERMDYHACPVCDQRVDTDEDLLQDRKFFKGLLYLTCPHCSTELVVTEWTRSTHTTVDYYYEIERRS